MKSSSQVTLFKSSSVFEQVPDGQEVDVGGLLRIVREDLGHAERGDGGQQEQGVVTWIRNLEKY